MPPPSDTPPDQSALREHIIGMGATSLHKSYYPILQQRVKELERFRALIDETTDMIMVVRVPDNKLIDVNRACTTQLNYPLADLLALDMFMLIAPHKREIFREFLIHAAASRKQEKIETALVASDGAEIPVELSLRVVMLREGKFGIVVARDIRERIGYEQALLKTQKKLNLINSLTRTDIKSQVFLVMAYLEVLKTIAKHPDEMAILDKLQRTASEIQRHIEFAENYQDVGVQTPRWQNFNEVLIYAVSHLPPIPITRVTSLESIILRSDPLFEKGLMHLMEYIFTHGKITKPVRIAHKESGKELVISLEINGTGIAPEKKESLFTWKKTKTNTENLFFVREILAITSITIHETGDADTIRFELRIPPEGYRID